MTRQRAVLLLTVVLAGIWLPCVHAVSFTLKDLGTLPGYSSLPSAINSSGQVAGTATNSSGGQTAFLYSPGVGFTDLGALGVLNGAAPMSQAYGISDNG